jgi:hypothetical protein
MGAAMVTGDHRTAKIEYRQRRLKLLDGFRRFFLPRIQARSWL